MTSRLLFVRAAQIARREARRSREPEDALSRLHNSRRNAVSHTSGSRYP